MKQVMSIVLEFCSWRSLQEEALLIIHDQLERLIKLLFFCILVILYIQCHNCLVGMFQMNLVDWFKGMVASRRGEEVVDPLIGTQPSPRPLKRALLVCLRCIDMDVIKRPKMGQIVHMLEADEFPFRSVSFVCSL